MPQEPDKTSAAPKQCRTSINNASIASVEWGSRCNPLVLFAHGTGLHARCWDRVIAHLRGYHIIATDHRGHGQSSNSPPYCWYQLGADLAAFITALDLNEINGVGHSMGGHCMVQAAAMEPNRFRRLTLFDPVIMEPSMYAMTPDSSAADHPVGRRRNVWDSPAQMMDRLQDRKPFSDWQADVLADYCKHGLTPTDSGYELACPPVVEAGILTSWYDSNVHDLLYDVEVPVTVVRASGAEYRMGPQDLSLSPTWPALASRFANGNDKYVPEHSHFLPMENPALAASIIATNLGGAR